MIAKPAICRAASRATWRRCATIISPTVAARANTGSSAMSMNTPGRSLYVRLRGPDAGPGAAGKWTDAATGEHGDLLDLIRLNRNFPRLTEAIDEARAFLALPRSLNRRRPPSRRSRPDRPRPPAACFAPARPIAGTLAEAYLRARGITGPLDWPALRFHPSVYYRATRRQLPLQIWPALLAAVTDLDGAITGRPAHLARSAASGESAAHRSTPGTRPSARQRRSFRG